MSETTVVVLSGGVDSTTLAYDLWSSAERVVGMSVRYGQRHSDRELDAARSVAASLGAEHRIVDLSGIGSMLTGCALTDPSVSVPTGRYDAASMRVTVVPNRNALLLDLAVALAVTIGASSVAFGAHAGDHPIYPDCRPAFIDAFQTAARLGNAGLVPAGFRVLAPFLGMSKADIVSLGARLGVPFALTWSCYQGGTKHCGACGTCVERREAFQAAGVPDPTVYAEVGP